MTQHPVYDGEGLAECGNLFEKLRELLPKDTVVSEADLPDAFANVLRHYWFYGYSSQMVSFASCPTGLPMIKLLVAGEVRWVVFEPVTTVTALQEIDTTLKSITDITEALEQLTFESLAGLKEKGAQMFVGTQHAKQIMYIPTGFICAEQCMNGMLVYGIRRTFAMSSQTVVPAYTALAGLHDKTNKKGAKMHELVDVLQRMTE